MQILVKMQTNDFGEIIYDEHDLIDLIMSGHDVRSLVGLTVSQDLDPQSISQITDVSNICTWQHGSDTSMSLQQYDEINQNEWYMPQQYRDLDVAELVLSRCHTQDELQRAGQELLMFQERGWFDLLRYMVYLVDVMRDNNIVWGVGRGSSVASFVLYKIGIHRVDSLYYDLDPRQFLR